MSNRNWHRCDCKIGNKIRYRGITNDLEGCDHEHQQR